MGLDSPGLEGSDEPRYWNKGNCSQSGGSKIKNKEIGGNCKSKVKNTIAESNTI